MDFFPNRVVEPAGFTETLENETQWSSPQSRTQNNGLHSQAIQCIEYLLSQALHILNLIHILWMNVEPLPCPNRRVIAQNPQVLEQGYAICTEGLLSIWNIAPNMLLGIIKCTESLIPRKVNSLSVLSVSVQLPRCKSVRGDYRGGWWIPQAEHEQYL